MALLLNLHFLVTVAIVFGLYKLNSRVLLSHRLVDGLRMWLPPSDEAVAAIKAPDGKRKRRALKNELGVDMAVVQNLCLRSLRLFGEFDTLVFFSLAGLGSFLFSEFWLCMLPAAQPSGFSALMLLLPAAYAAYCCIKISFASPTERFLSVGFGALLALALVAALRLLPDWAFDVPRADAVTAFNSQLTQILREAKMTPSRAVALTVPVYDALLVSIALALGIVLAVPAMRFARCYLLLTEGRSFRLSRVARAAADAAAHVSVMAPLAVLLLWVPPLAKEPLAGPDGLLSARAFEALRLAASAAALAPRVALFRDAAQMYLAQGFFEVAETEFELGPDTARAIQRKLRDTLAFAPAALLQLASPLVIGVALALLAKRHAAIDVGVCAAVFGAAPTASPSSQPAVSLVANELWAPTASFALAAYFAALGAATLLALAYFSFVAPRRLAARVKAD